MTQLQDLTIHVGLPKTGTTTLQREVFPHFPGYVCGTESTGHSGDLAQRMLQLYQVKGAHRDWRTDDWRLEATAWWAEARGTADGPLLVSLEGLFRWFDPVTGLPWPLMGNGKYSSHRTGHHPVVGFLAALQNHFDGCRIRVALTLRNQADFLASHYAQISYRLSNPSQSDFEAKVQNAISLGDPFFNWFDTSARIINLFGAGNVQISVFECGLDSVARNLANFLHNDWSPTPINTHHNAKRQQQTWVLTVPRHRRILSLTRPGRLRHIAKKIQTRSYRAQGSNSTGRRGHRDRLVLPRELQREIQRAFQQDNMKLGDLIGVDLSEYGY